MVNVETMIQKMHLTTLPLRPLYFFPKGRDWLIEMGRVGIVFGCLNVLSIIYLHLPVNQPIGKSMVNLHGYSIVCPLIYLRSTCISSFGWDKPILTPIMNINMNLKHVPGSPGRMADPVFVPPAWSINLWLFEKCHGKSGHKLLMIFHYYLLVNQHKQLWRITFLNGKTHELSIAIFNGYILNFQRVD